MTRTFDDRPATREKVPLLIGLVGPSSTGKTYSALRLATGIQKVSGGEVFFIDTEARRALHYADRFSFRHLAMGAPFGPLDYLAAIEHCCAKGAGTIIVDSMSNEHEGVGGVLEMHEAEHRRLGGKEGTKLLAWGKPKRERRRLINTVLQMSVNFIFCWRAKQKLKIERGKDPEQQGYMPIAGDEFIYEMTVKCLLLPGANGTPSWSSMQPGEKAMIKLPEQFRETFASAPQLTEDIGQQLASWAAGAPAPAAVGTDELTARYVACHDAATLRTLEDARRVAWSTLNGAGKAKVKAAAEDATARVRAALEAYESEADSTEIDNAEQGAA